MADPAHLAVLSQGPQAWNAWRATQRAAQGPDPDLCDFTLDVSSFGPVTGDHFDFSSMRFEKTKFDSVTLPRADFGDSQLQNVVFGNCNLAGASFEGATITDCEFLSDGSLERVDFLRATIRKSVFFTQDNMRWLIFDRVTMEQVVFRRGRMEQCEFGGGAIVGNCTFDRVSLIGCNFQYADLSRSRFIGTRFEKVNLFGANLSGVDLRGADGYQFDNNLAQGIIMSPVASDDWTVLRRSYTGPRMVFTLIFLALYFSPLGIKAAVLMQIAKLEESSDKIVETLKHLASALSLSQETVVRLVGVLLERLIAHFPCLAGGCDVSLLAVVFGVNGWGKATCFGKLLLLTVPFLLLYNLGRLILTMLIAPLRDEEQRSGHVPRRNFNNDEPDFLLAPLTQGTQPPRITLRRRAVALWQRITLRYRWMVYLHGGVQVLAWLAYGLAVINFVRFLTAEVVMP